MKSAIVVGIICSCLMSAWECEGANRTRTFRVRYVANVTGIPMNSEKVRLWVPLPRQDASQEITNELIESPYPYSITREPRFGNRMLYVDAGNVHDNFSVTASYTVLRHEISASSGYGNDTTILALSRKPSRLVPLSEQTRKIALGATGEERKPIAQAKLLYEHVLQTMSYDKSGKGWGRGDFNYACDVRKGNCTDFHSYFIGLCRGLGLGAYFEIGLSIPAGLGDGEIGGYHCWAYFWNGTGWIPVDISEAWKNADRRTYFFGAIDENRVALSRGRDIVLKPPQEGEPLNFFVFPYAEVDGKVYPHIEKKTFLESPAH